MLFCIWKLVPVLHFISCVVAVIGIMFIVALLFRVAVAFCQVESMVTSRDITSLDYPMHDFVCISAHFI